MTPEEFEAIREEIGMTRPQIAEALGVSRAQVSNWAAGRSPISMIVQLALMALKLGVRVR